MNLLENKLEKRIITYQDKFSELEEKEYKKYIEDKNNLENFIIVLNFVENSSLLFKSKYKTSLLNDLNNDEKKSNEPFNYALLSSHLTSGIEINANLKIYKNIINDLKTKINEYKFINKVGFEESYYALLLLKVFSENFEISKYEKKILESFQQVIDKDENIPPRELYFIVKTLNDFFPDVLSKKLMKIENILSEQLKTSHMATIYFSLNTLALIKEKITLESDLYKNIKNIINNILSNDNYFDFNKIITYGLAEIFNVNFSSSNLEKDLKKLFDENTSLIKFDASFPPSWEATSIVYNFKSEIIKNIFDKEKIKKSFDNKNNNGLIYSGEKIILREIYFAYELIKRIS